MSVFASSRTNALKIKTRAQQQKQLIWKYHLQKTLQTMQRHKISSAAIYINFVEKNIQPYILSASPQFLPNPQSKYKDTKLIRLIWGKVRLQTFQAIVGKLTKSHQYHLKASQFCTKIKASVILNGKNNKRNKLHNKRNK